MLCEAIRGMSSKHIRLLLVFVLLMNLACTKYARVPETEYDSIDKKVDTPAKITKTDGTTYVVRRFEVTDESILIHQFEKNPGYHDSDGIKDPSAPYRVPKSDILKIEKIETNKVGAIALVSLVLIVVLTVGAFIFAKGLGEGLSGLN
jgi:hypothetical protein